MKISIITVVYNNVFHIESCIKSVISQTYKDIEYIVIDNKSSDGTEKIIQDYRSNIDVIISEKDNSHIEAMNKGLRISKGDVIGFLHSDDFYPHKDVIGSVADVFKDKSIDSLYGDLVYIKNKKEKILRYWKSGDFIYRNIAWGWMPPHPTFFVRKRIYEKYGSLDDKNFKISMDYEFILRLLYKYKVKTKYIPKVLVVMRSGGVSNRGVKNLIVKSKEDYRALRNHNLGLKTLLMKNLVKIPQFFKRQKKDEKKRNKTFR